jgi:haloalkane dehalogenase
MNVIDGEFGDLFVEPLALSKEVAAGQLALVADFDWSVIDRMEETHRKIVAPALLLWGERDPWFPLSRARKMVSQFPGGAEVRALPGRLFVHEELPHLWANQALEFLAQCVEDGEEHVENQRVENERAHLTVS